MKLTARDQLARIATELRFSTLLVTVPPDGRLEFIRADTLFALERKVEVSYEENPIFAPSPTTLAGFVVERPMSHGVIDFTAIDQSQKSPFLRPELGFETNSTLTAGVTGAFNWDAPALTRIASRLSSGPTAAASHRRRRSRR